MAIVITVVLAMFAGPMAPASSAQTTLGNYSEVSVRRSGTTLLNSQGLHANHAGATKRVFDEWERVKTNVENTMVAMLAPEIDLQMRRAANVKLKALEIDILEDTPLNLNFRADGNGKITANLTFPTVRVWIKGKRPDYDTTIKITEHIGPVKASLDYDVFTGVVDNATIHDLPLRTDVKVRTGIAGKILSFGLSFAAFWFAGTLFPVVKQLADSIPLALRVVGGAVSTGLQNPNLADSIATAYGLIVVGDAVDQFKGQFLPVITNFSAKTFGLDSVLSYIPAGLSYQGTNVRQFIRDAINKNLKGNLVTIQIGRGVSSLSLPWGSQSQSGVNTLSIKVASYELRLRHAAVQNPCDAYAGNYSYQQSCMANLYYVLSNYQPPGYQPPATTTTTTRPPTTTTTTRPPTTTTAPSSDQRVRSNAAAAAAQLSQAQQQLQAQLSALAAQLQANPSLATSIGPMAYQLAAQMQAIQQALAVAQQCASGTITAQCRQLYG